MDKKTLYVFLNARRRKKRKERKGVAQKDLFIYLTRRKTQVGEEKNKRKKNKRKRGLDKKTFCDKKLGHDNHNIKHTYIEW